MPDGLILTWEFHGESARLCNINTGDFTCMGLAESVIFCAGHASLADGSMLVAGGGDHNAITKETNIFRYGATIGGVGPWEVGPDMGYERFYPTCTTLSDGSILVVAGSDSNGVDILIPEITIQ